MVYVVSYTLRLLPIDLLFQYKAIVVELQKSQTWTHTIDNTWLIYTTESIQQLHSRLVRHIRADRDWLLIVPVDLSQGYQGWLPAEAWEWIEKLKGMGG